MYQPGATETIWHFIGYMHLADELARARIDYDNFRYKQYIEAENYDAQLEGANINVMDFQATSGDGYKLDLPREGGKVKIIHKTEDPVPPVILPEEFARDYAPDIEKYLPGHSFGPVGNEPNYYLIRWEGGSQKWIEIHQTNNIYTHNYFGVPWDSTCEYMSPSEAAAEFSALIKMAHEAMPAEYMVQGEHGTDVLEFFLNHHADLADSGEAPQQVTSGVYVDGVLQEEGTEVQVKLFNDEGVRELGAPPPMPGKPGAGEEEEDDSVPGDVENGFHASSESGYDEYASTTHQAANVGGKLAQNSAVIVDANEVCGAMVVMGDWHVTNAIFQVNVYSDNDYIQIGGSGEGSGIGAYVDSASNTATNRAEMGTNLSLVEEAIDNRGLTGYNWEIETVHGDFYDVKTLFQENWISSTDITAQTVSSAHYNLTVGATGQVNSISIDDMGATNYDLIIVLGNYHSGNYIKQTNVIHDPDYVMSANFSGDGADQSIYTGHNYLLNTASIYSYTGSEYQEVTDEFHSFLDQVENADYIEPETWWELSGTGSTTMNVLFVTGNYYDINYICQTNYISDLDSAMQMYAPGGAGGEQYLSAGGNTAENYAAIYDFGSYGDQFLGGTAYEESMLHQTNIVAGDDDEIVYGDANELAGEIVAFTNQNVSDMQEDNEAYVSGAEIAAGGDVMGGVMA